MRRTPRPISDELPAPSLAPVTLVSLALVALMGCSPSSKKSASGAGTSTSRAPTPVASAPAAPVPTAPGPTEPPVGPGTLGTILFTAADLPTGFMVAPIAETGEGSTSLRLCDQPITATGPGVTSARAVFDQPWARQRLVQQALAFNAGDPGSLVVRIRQLGDSCRRSGALAVKPFDPPAVGEAVAGLQVTGDGQAIDVAVVRSGPIDVLLILTKVGGPIDGPTLDAIVAAAGTKLAVGTGG